MFKKLTLTALPTDKATTLYYNNRSKSWCLANTKDGSPIKSENRVGDCTNNHLYLTSDEEIKEGDWAFDHSSQQVIKIKAQEVRAANGVGLTKIVASTDPKLLED